MFIDKGVQNKIQKLNLTIEAIFKDGEDLVKQLIKTQHHDINLENAKTEISAIYSSVLNTVSAIDKSLIGSTESEKQKAINGIAALEQKNSVGGGINHGILYLMAIPYVLIAFIFRKQIVALWKSFRGKKIAEDEL